MPLKKKQRVDWAIKTEHLDLANSFLYRPMENLGIACGLYKTTYQAFYENLPIQYLLMKAYWVELVISEHSDYSSRLRDLVKKDNCDALFQRCLNAPESKSDSFKMNPLTEILDELKVKNEHIESARIPHQLKTKRDKQALLRFIIENYWTLFNLNKNSENTEKCLEMCKYLDRIEYLIQDLKPTDPFYDLIQKAVLTVSKSKNTTVIKQAANIVIKENIGFFVGFINNIKGVFENRQEPISLQEIIKIQGAMFKEYCDKTILPLLAQDVKEEKNISKKLDEIKKHYEEWINFFKIIKSALRDAGYYFEIIEKFSDNPQAVEFITYKESLENFRKMIFDGEEKNSVSNTSLIHKLLLGFHEQYEQFFKYIETLRQQNPDKALSKALPMMDNALLKPFEEKTSGSVSPVQKQSDQFSTTANAIARIISDGRDGDKNKKKQIDTDLENKILNELHQLAGSSSKVVQGEYVKNWAKASMNVLNEVFKIIYQNDAGNKDKFFMRQNNRYAAFFLPKQDIARTSTERKHIKILKNLYLHLLKTYISRIDKNDASNDELIKSHQEFLNEAKKSQLLSYQRTYYKWLVTKKSDSSKAATKMVEQFESKMMVTPKKEVEFDFSLGQFRMARDSQDTQSASILGKSVSDVSGIQLGNLGSSTSRLGS